MLNISVVLDLANDYSVNAGVFRDSGNFVSEELDRDQRQELIANCESYIKLQEEIEKTRFSFDEASSSSPAKKKRKKKTAKTSL